MDAPPTHGDGVDLIAHVKVHPPDLPDRAVPRQGRVLIAFPCRIIVPRPRARWHEELCVGLRRLAERLREVVQKFVVHVGTSSEVFMPRGP